MTNETPENTEETTVETPVVPFKEWNLGPLLLKGLEEIGYSEPTKVQNAVYPIAEGGKDLMVQSHTGSGKTAAFGIPIINKIDVKKLEPQALILAPTRELALQVSRELSRIGEFHDASIIPIYGGAPIQKQIDQLEAGAQIIAGTPGRVMDHLKRGTLNPSSISHLVLDECDEMLSMGFQEDIETIVKQLPKPPERQTFLFSATIPPAIERLGKRFMQDYEMIQLSSDSVGVDLIDHFYYVVTGIARPKNLYHILCSTKPESAIIFCNTREETTTVAKYLTKRGFSAAAINSDLSQKERERVLSGKRDGSIKFLVATDIAARGIDISDLSHVINYTFPESAEVYIHRTGRTGRAGKDGVAFSLIGPKDIGSFYNLKLIYKILPEERELPSDEEIATFEADSKKRTFFSDIRSLKAKTDKNKGLAVQLAKSCLKESDSEHLVAQLIEHYLTPKEKAKTRNAPKDDTRSAKTRERSDSEGREETRERSFSKDGENERKNGRKRRRRGRGEPRDGRQKESSQNAESASSSEASSEPKRERSTKSKDSNGVSKSRTRRESPKSKKPSPKTNPDGNVEFWEAWADDKPTTKPAKAKATDSKDVSQGATKESTKAEPSTEALASESSEPPRKKRRRRRRPSQES